MILLPLLIAALPQGVPHVRSLLPLDGELLSLETADADGDGRLDLFLAVRRENGDRVIQVHRLREDGALPTRPDHEVQVKSDIVCWGVGEFIAAEAGAELLLTTRNSAFALSPRAEGYRGILKLGSGDWLLDLPSHRQLPAWPAIADLDGDGLDEVVLPTWTGFRILAADGDVFGDIPLRPASGRRPALDRAYKIGPVTVSGQPLSDLMVPDEDPGALEPPPAAYASEALPLPWLADSDGDGLLDLVYEWQGVITVHRQRPAGVVPRFEPAPDVALPYEDGGDWEVASLELVDAGGGPAVDLMVTRREKEIRLSGDWQVLLFFDPFLGQGSMARPDSLVATEAGLVGVHLADVAPVDGRLDLILSSWTLDVGVIGGSKVDIEHQVLVYPAGEDGRHPRRPELKYQREYDADDFTAFSQVPPAPGDLAGDGGADLLEADPHGVLEFRAITFRDGKLRVSEQPVRRIEVEALSSRVLVTDLDGDGTGDLMVLKKQVVEVYVARSR
ncbi:MAG: hypothetical protein ISR76_07575 [Planctomycetes bacterium]|nr:hypothetical protein [Planctomycetota bacterium]MBL7008843.1 hypothetical protein [Planctomycetota bacterium]